MYIFTMAAFSFHFVQFYMQYKERLKWLLFLWQTLLCCLLFCSLC